MKLIVTTSHAAREVDANLKEFLTESGFTCYPRGHRSVQRLAHDYEADGVIVWQDGYPVLYIEGEKFFFHPSMARVRLGAYRKMGTVDPLVKACQLEPHYSFLDCTMGLGADLIVASYFLPQGRVVGLESSAGIARVVEWGMKLYQCAQEWMLAAIGRVSVIHNEHLEYLRKLPDASFDIVFFDPMFRKPLLHSQAISPLRGLADPRAIEEEAIKEACRVARQRVVLKERRGSEEFDRLGFHQIVGSQNNNIVFGVIET